MSYSIGHIYKIICNLDSSFCYIGSTFNQLRHRWQSHKKDYKYNKGTFSIHKYFDKYGIDNFKLILIKSYNVVRTHRKDHKHLEAYETLWINKTKNCVNKLLPFNPLRKEQMKQYRENNKEKIAEINKQYYEDNKQKIKEYKKQYYEINKEEKMKQNFNCDCGGKYTYINKARHLKTKRHKTYLQNLDNNN